MPDLPRGCFECDSFQRGASYQAICSWAVEQRSSVRAAAVPLPAPLPSAARRLPLQLRGLMDWGEELGRNFFLFLVLRILLCFNTFRSIYLYEKTKPYLPEVISPSVILFSLLNSVVWINFLIALSYLYITRSPHLTAVPVPSSNLPGFYGCFSFISDIIVNALLLSNL